MILVAILTACLVVACAALQAMLCDPSESEVPGEIKLGEGTFGSVFASPYRVGGIPVVHKRFRSPETDDWPPLVEIAAFRALPAHYNVVPFVGFFMDAQSMPVLQLRRMQVTMRKAADMIRNEVHDPHPLLADLYNQLTDGVAHLHANKMMHRDLKPENVLVDDPTKNGSRRVTICDLGLAAPVVPGRLNTLLVQSLWWRAPEVLCGVADYTASIDAWSLGIILLGLVLPSERAFQGQSECDQRSIAVGLCQTNPANALRSVPDEWALSLALTTMHRDRFGEICRNHASDTCRALGYAAGRACSVARCALVVSESPTAPDRVASVLRRILPRFGKFAENVHLFEGVGTTMSHACDMGDDSAVVMVLTPRQAEVVLRQRPDVALPICIYEREPPQLETAAEHAPRSSAILKRVVLRGEGATIGVRTDLCFGECTDVYADTWAKLEKRSPPAFEVATRLLCHGPRRIIKWRGGEAAAGRGAPSEEGTPRLHRGPPARGERDFSARRDFAECRLVVAEFAAEADREFTLGLLTKFFARHALDEGVFGPRLAFVCLFVAVRMRKGEDRAYRMLAMHGVPDDDLFWITCRRVFVAADFDVFPSKKRRRP